jgi:hypothetical protein
MVSSWRRGGLVSSIDDTWPTTVMGSTETSSLHSQRLHQKCDSKSQQTQIGGVGKTPSSSELTTKKGWSSKVQEAMGIGQKFV